MNSESLQKITHKQRVKRIHFIGMGGSGMSGIAEVVLNEGYEVSGSDLSENAGMKRLKALGAITHIGHFPENIQGADLIVASTAIAENNPEIVAAQQQRIPIIPRAQMLAELMRERFGIAVAGTHGKTTTTSLVTAILSEAGLDPTFIIGGLLNSAGTNAKLGTSQYLVAEADESDASFLYLQPNIAIVTNVDADHIWSYENSFDKIKQTFIEFLHHLPLSGLAVLCIDDQNIRELLPQVGRPLITYGFADDADYRITAFQQVGVRCQFSVESKKYEKISVSLNLAGKHNVLNAVAAIIVAKEVGVKDDAILQALKKFSGVGRRFQIRGEYHAENESALVIDDYGHHPREMHATISAIRAAWPQHRLVMAFQPHRYTRTMALFDDFAQVLSEVDQLSCNDK